MDVHACFNRAIACLVVGVMLAIPSIASAAGTGDGPTGTKDVLSAKQAAARTRGEATTRRLVPTGAAERAIADAPFRYLWTTTHEQERSYWCGPATVQVIDDYFGTPLSQQAYANYLGTTTSGSDFSRIDDALRHFTGKPYYYYGGLTQATARTRILDTIVNHAQPMTADVSIDGSAWPVYVYDHAGHIIPIEAYDGRTSNELIRINDVYDEAGSRAGGGDTLGHTTYTYAVIWDGIGDHPRRAVVSAP